MKTRRPLLAAFFLAALSFGACGRKEESPLPENRSSPGKTPPYYYDLGSPTVDVSGYPERHRENYRFFLSVCGSCHTTARPLNAPYADGDAWKRYVHKMHLKMKGRGIDLDRTSEERIVDFLAYDSKVRKVNKHEEFESQQNELKKLFEEMTKSKF